MKREPQIGDIVRIGGKKDLLVVEARDTTSYAYDGAYPAFVFNTIPYVQGEVTDPKTKSFLISGCINPNKGQTVVNLIDIEWIGSAKVKKKVSTTYTVK